MMTALPEGYTTHDGGDCPVDPETFVDCIVRTAQGLGHSGVVRAKLHEWNAAAHEGGLGAVVGYRLAGRGEEIDVMARWPEE